MIAEDEDSSCLVSVRHISLMKILFRFSMLLFIFINLALIPMLGFGLGSREMSLRLFGECREFFTLPRQSAEGCASYEPTQPHQGVC